MAEAALAAAAASSAGTAAATFSTLATVALVSIYGSIAGSEKTPTTPETPAAAPAPAATVPPPAPAPPPAAVSARRKPGKPGKVAPPPAPAPAAPAAEPAAPPGESPAAVATPSVDLPAAAPEPAPAPAPVAVPVPLPSAPPAPEPAPVAPAPEEPWPTPASEETCRERHEDIFNLLKFGTYRGIRVDQMVLTKDETKQLLREVNFRPGITRMRRSIFGTTLQALLDDCRNPLGLRPVDDIALINRWITFFASLDVPLGYVPSIRYTPLDEAGRRKFTGPAAVAPPAPEAPAAVPVPLPSAPVAAAEPPAPEAPAAVAPSAPVVVPPAPDARSTGTWFNVLPPGQRDAYHIIDPQADTRYKQWLNLNGEAPRKHGIPPPPPLPPAEPTPAEKAADSARRAAAASAPGIAAAKLEEAKKKIAAIQSDVEARKAAEAAAIQSDVEARKAAKAARLPVGTTASGQDPQSITWSRYGAVADGNCFYDSFLYATVPEHRTKNLRDRAVAADAFREEVRNNQAAILPHLRDVYALPTGESPIDDAELGRIFEEEVQGKEYASTQLAMAIARWKGQRLVIINGDSLARDATQIEPAKLVPGASDVPDDTHPAVTLSYLESIQHFEPVSINDQFTVPGAEYPDGLRAILESTQGAVVPVPPPPPPPPPPPAPPVQPVVPVPAEPMNKEDYMTARNDIAKSMETQVLDSLTAAQVAALPIWAQAMFKSSDNERYTLQTKSEFRQTLAEMFKGEKVARQIKSSVTQRAWKYLSSRFTRRKGTPPAGTPPAEATSTFTVKNPLHARVVPPHLRGTTRTPILSPAAAALVPPPAPAPAPLPPPAVVPEPTPAPAPVVVPPPVPAVVPAPPPVVVPEPVPAVAPAPTPEAEAAVEALAAEARANPPATRLEPVSFVTQASVGKQNARSLSVVYGTWRDLLAKRVPQVVTAAEYAGLSEDEKDMFTKLPSGDFKLREQPEYVDFVKSGTTYKYWTRRLRDEGRDRIRPDEYEDLSNAAKLAFKPSSAARDSFQLKTPSEYMQGRKFVLQASNERRVASESAAAPAPAVSAAPPPPVAAAAPKAAPSKKPTKPVESTSNPPYTAVVPPPPVPNAELERLRRRYANPKLKLTLNSREYDALSDEDKQFYTLANAWGGTGPEYNKRGPKGLFPLSSREGGSRKKTFKSRRGKKTNVRGTRRRKDRANRSHSNSRRRT